jgi:hypothetical protein
MTLHDSGQGAEPTRTVSGRGLTAIVSALLALSLMSACGAPPEGDGASEDGIRTGDAGELTESLAANGLTESSRTAAFRIGQTNPPSELLPEHAVLLL